MHRHWTLICWLILFPIVGLFSFPTWSTPPQKCLVCNFSYSSQSSQSGQSDPCDDLFGAACLNKDGTPKYKGAYEKKDKGSD